jgi:hypothetical protein
MVMVLQKFGPESASSRKILPTTFPAKIVTPWQLETACWNATLEWPDGRSETTQIVLLRKVKEVLVERGGGSSRGRLDVDRTLGNVRQQYYWLHARNSAESWFQLRDTCAISPLTRSWGLINQYNFGAGFERMVIDIAAPFAEIQKRNISLIRVITIDYSPSGQRFTASQTRSHRRFLMCWWPKPSAASGSRGNCKATKAENSSQNCCKYFYRPSDCARRAPPLCIHSWTARWNAMLRQCKALEKGRFD